MISEIRVAMIGCGPRATAYPGTLGAARGSRLVALCDLVAPRVRKIKDLAGDPAIREYTDHRKMFADGGFEAVFVVTEPEYQARLSIEAMEAGYHVFSEVPVCYDLDECWRLVVAAERTGRVYYLGEQMRHAPLMRYWKRIVQDGLLGTVLFAEGHYIHAMAANRFWRESGTGELLTWEQARKCSDKVKSRIWTMSHPILYGPHKMSPLLKILDDRVISVSCYSSGSPSKRYKEVPFPCQEQEFPVPDMEVALMQTAKGAIMRFAANFQVPLSEPHWYHLLGTKGELETRRGAGEPGHSYFNPAPVLVGSPYCFPRTAEPWFEPSGQPPPEIAAWLEKDLPHEAKTTGHGGTDYYPVADFVRCLREGAKPDVDVYQAVDTAAPCILAVRSAEQGGAMMQVPDFRPGPKREKGRMPE